MNRRRDMMAGGAAARALLHCAPAVALCLLAGCAPLRWQKPGADTAALEQDLQECRQLAAVAARREEIPQLFSGRVMGTDRDGRPIVVPAAPQPSDRFLREQDLTGTCMRRKGYVLEADPGG